LNDLRQLVLHHLFHLPFFLRHEQDALDAHCVLVLLPLSEQGDRDVKPHHELGVQNEKLRHVSDDQVLLNWIVLDEPLFQDVQISMNPNERGARCENGLVLD
jgi:hypothetical protein